MGADDKVFASDKIVYNLKKEELFKDIRQWKIINYGCEKCVAEYSDTSNKSVQVAWEQLKNDKKAAEMELKCSNIIVNPEDGIFIWFTR